MNLINEEEAEDNDLFEHYKFKADKGQELLRIDKFLMDRIPNTTRNKLQNALTEGHILVNKKPVKANYRVKPLDDITVELPYPPQEIELIPEDIPLNILYEDDDVIVLNKDAGLVVHPGFGNHTGTLVNGLIYHFKNLPETSMANRPGLVHRLDKNTTGVMVIAKTEHALSHLGKQFFDRTIERRYQALVWGDFEEEDGTVVGNVGRSLQNRKVMSVFPEEEFGKHAITHYKVLKRFGYVTLIECKLETGRTHQIRVHMQHIKHPLFNDEDYGGDRILKGTSFTKYKQFINNCFEILPRQALHAKSLGFEHPATGKWLHFETDLPEDMTKLLEKWDGYISNRNTFED
ncbi:MAG: RluA family pseudouridine synthase [Flavobacteriales bacterium]|jgi:23S rRNA pseudouridine1911/1915/1917 synthase|nr:RNA pseudouridine synthase [Flavobacteriales bacterium]MCW8897290.1 RluA family pseudouridine synthase [Flavobacteriales bacterium]MCW8913652.1 RluA family pseudouridine synthase [Flavobacteriales bacterium]MCW8937156.1 RluA family pseudouridine synthase [Flavobacteriales bacterium]MCW8940351.1 RluA family pseudouridine synthase [Flavobacteriales bacterium]|tara:strand:+ start:4303 stop:5343 length:1041 start_codon:yes stop_codon:yes gene_type:complete